MRFRDVTLINVALIDKPLCVMNYMYADVTEKIIGASMKIHRYLGNGFQEEGRKLKTFSTKETFELEGGYFSTIPSAPKQV